MIFLFVRIVDHFRRDYSVSRVNRESWVPDPLEGPVELKV